MKLTFETRAFRDSIKAFYVGRINHLGERAQVFAAGLTTADNWRGVKGMLVIGGFPDCTGGHKASRSYHFRLLGLRALGSFVRRPRWFWKPWYRLASWLQYRVDTRYSKR